MEKVIFEEKSHQNIGLCMEVHNNLGAGFKEIVYKDVLELEFQKANIPPSLIHLETFQSFPTLGMCHLS